jgi:hypothetical protein|tara:strand:- start:261 stop:452 length:192 start_codon:yes stop_codon:yes gene_type:complete
MVKAPTTMDIAMLIAMFLWLMATLTLACLPIFIHDGLVELWFALCMIFGIGGFISMAVGFIKC